MWTLICSLSFEDLLKAFPHSWHSKFMMWFCKCLLRCKKYLKAFPQFLHSWGFSPVWISLCLLRNDWYTKAFPQSSHLWLFPPIDDLLWESEFGTWANVFPFWSFSLFVSAVENCLCMAWSEFFTRLISHQGELWAFSSTWVLSVLREQSSPKACNGLYSCVFLYISSRKWGPLFWPVIWVFDVGSIWVLNGMFCHKTLLPSLFVQIFGLLVKVRTCFKIPEAGLRLCFLMGSLLEGVSFRPGLELSLVPPYSWTPTRDVSFSWVVATCFSFCPLCLPGTSFWCQVQSSPNALSWELLLARQALLASWNVSLARMFHWGIEPLLLHWVTQSEKKWYRDQFFDGVPTVAQQ